MIHSTRYTAILDTNVIFPIEIRDMLFWFAHYDIYTPKWSKQIFDEWKSVMRKKGVDEREIAKRINNANLAFPDALVSKYEELIKAINLPDEDDRHVVAAAMKTNANVIVTKNLKHFPLDYLSTLSLYAQSPDDFLTDMIDLNPDKATAAFKEMVLNRTNPDLDEFEVLNVLRNNGLQDTANYLHSQL